MITRCSRCLQNCFRWFVYSFFSHLGEKNEERFQWWDVNGSVFFSQKSGNDNKFIWSQVHFWASRIDSLQFSDAFTLKEGGAFWLTDTKRPHRKIVQFKVDTHSDRLSKDERKLNSTGINRLILSNSIYFQSNFESVRKKVQIHGKMPLNLEAWTKWKNNIGFRPFSGVFFN